MSWNQISKRWRKNLVNKLQERYGLAEEEARKKADAWLQWIGKQPIPPSPGSFVHSGKSRSRAAGRS